MLSNKVYDILKWVAQCVIPAVGALYFGLAQIWGFPFGEEIVGTLALIDTFMGALLGISTAKYNKTNCEFEFEPEEEFDDCEDI